MNLIYHPHARRGGGYRVLTIHGESGPVQLKSLNEKLLAARIIQAHLILGASRQEAEAAAAEEVQARHQSRRWFCRRSTP